MGSCGKVRYLRYCICSQQCLFSVLCLLSFVFYRVEEEEEEVEEEEVEEEEETFLSSLSLLPPRLLFSRPLRELGHWTESSLTS